MDAFIGMLINRFAELTASALALALATFIFRSYKSISGYIGNKIKSSNNAVLQEAMNILQEIVVTCVKEAEQTIVVSEKNGAEKLSKESIDKIQNHVITRVKNNMPTYVMELLRKYGVNLDGIIISFIERAVLESKYRIDNPVKEV